MPTHLVNVIKQMYDGDEYVLIDGAKTTSTGNSAVPLRGVKQGCPLSPLLFSLYINDVDDEFGSGFVGAVMGTEGLRVTHMLYADDLTLTANDPVQLQKMLRRLELYAARKGLAVNVQKSYIANFFAYQNSAVPVFRLYNQELKERDNFTYLGMLFDKHVNLHHAASHALKSFNAAIRKSLVLKKMISDRPHAMLWLFKTYALSAGMYASQIWSMQFLKHDNGFSNPFQVAHITLSEFRELNLLLQIGVCFENARRNPFNFTGSGQLSNFGTGWLIQTAILYAML
jgi:hypothetical protein